MSKACKISGCERKYSAKGFCQYHYNLAWRRANPDKQSEYDARREWTPERRASRAASCRRWAEKNKEYDKARRKRYYEENRDEILRKWSVWRESNKERLAESFREWCLKHPVANRARIHKYVTSKTQAGGYFSENEWEALLDAFGHTCPRCGARPTLLEADHIVPVSKGGHSNIDNIQPLCRSCNAKKRDKTIAYLPWDGLAARVKNLLE